MLLIKPEPLTEYINQYRLRHFVFSNGTTPPAKQFPPRPEQCLTFYIPRNETSKYLAFTPSWTPLLDKYGYEIIDGNLLIYSWNDENDKVDIKITY